MGLAADINQPDETPLHSSGYADIANGGSMGAASTESFAQRQSLNGERRVVGGYNKSLLGSGYAPQEVSAQSYATSRQQLQKAPGRKSDTLSYHNQQRQAMNSQLQVPARPTASFREPPTRNYNPYA